MQNSVRSTKTPRTAWRAAVVGMTKQQRSIHAARVAFADSSLPYPSQCPTSRWTSPPRTPRPPLPELPLAPYVALIRFLTDGPETYSGLFKSP